MRLLGLSISRNQLPEPAENRVRASSCRHPLASETAVKGVTMSIDSETIRHAVHALRIDRTFKMSPRSFDLEQLAETTGRSVLP